MTHQLWLGSQNTYDAMMSAQVKGDNHPRFKADSGDSEGSWLARAIYESMVSVQDGVGIININGPLVTGSAGYSAFYGMVGYDDVRNAFGKLVANQGVISILLNVNSGGGHVGGVLDAAQLGTRVTAIKPVVTYTGSMMASAAMWLGAAAEHIVAAENSVVGSIGVMQVLFDRTKQLENDGIKATVIRAGEFKALANPYEATTERVVAAQTAQAEEMYKVFIQYMATQRGVTLTTADTKFGQGREFVGAQALAAGLVDQIGSFEDAFMKAQALGRTRAGAANRTNVPNKRGVQGKSGATTASLPDNLSNSEGIQNMSSPAFTTAQLEAMAAGVELPGDVPSLAPAVAEVVTEAAKPAEAVAPAADALTVLQAMLTTAQESLAQARLESSGFKASVDSMQAQFTAAIDIARNSVRTMGLHFGVNSAAVAAMPAADVLTEHSRISALFQDKFKVGGVAATNPSLEKVEPQKASMDPRLAARAARFPTGNRK